MCGICGWVEHRPTAAGEAVLATMTARLAHRGPDDSGTLIDRGAFLGHRRLAIIDPSPAGHQPLQHGPLAAVLNGELYNFRALRRALQRRRHRFVTRTDTEVLLQGFQAWGLTGLLDRIEGMFAFAIWDSDRRQLHLARDRMGQKPLYVAHLPSGALAFASELRALAAHPEVSSDIDPNALRKYLAFDYIPSPNTMLRGVQKLEPGYALTFQAGHPSAPHRYWRPPAPLKDLRGRRAQDTLWEAIRTGVRGCLVSDVPIGFFLSGGLDSTAVCAAACELGPAQDVHTFSVGFDDPSFDESTHAATVARHLGTTHHSERLTAQGLLDLIPPIVSALDEPLADPSLVPTHLLSRFTRRSVKVVIGGDGGDELLLGYPTFGAHQPARLASRIPSALRHTLINPAVSALPTSEANWSLDYKLKRFAASLDYPDFERHFVWIGGLAPHQHRHLLEPAIMRAGHEPPFADIHRALAALPTAPDDTDLDRLGRLYARLYLADGVLQKVDRASMAHGLECRAPLLAQEVLTTAARIPASQKLHRGVTKAVLRRALAGRIPQAILDRPKKGFGMPLTAWLKGPLRPLLRDLLDPAELRRQAIFKAEWVERLVREHHTGYRDHRKVLWALIVFQLWSRSR